MRVVSLDGMSLAHLTSLGLKAKAGSKLMNSISLCAECGAAPWTDDLIRHQRAMLRGATLDVLVCNACLAAVKVNNPTRETN